MKILLGAFIIAHGLIHLSYLAPKPEDPKYPFYFDRSWFAHMVGAAAQPIGITLMILTVILLSLAGLGIWGTLGLSAITKELILGGMGTSLLTLLLFWHPWLVLGMMIDIAFLFAILRLDWLAK